MTLPRLRPVTTGKHTCRHSHRHGIPLLRILPELGTVSVAVIGVALLLAAVLGDRPLDIGPTEGPAEQEQLRRIPDSFYALGQLADGDFVVSTYRSSIARLASDGTERWSVSRSSAGEPVVDLTPTHGLVGRADGTVLLHEGFDEQTAPAVLGKHDSAVIRVALDPRGRHAASSCQDGKTFVWDLERRKAVERLCAASESGPERLFFSPDGSLLARIQRDAVRIVRVPAGTAAAVLRLPDDVVATPIAAAFCEENRRFAIGGVGGWLMLWDLETGREVWKTKNTDGDVLVLGFAPGGEKLLAGRLGGTLGLYRSNDGTLLDEVDAHDKGVRIIQSTPSGEILTAGFDGAVRVWNLDPLRESRQIW